MAPAPGLVRLELEGPLATVTLDDPERRNALRPAMFDALDAALARAINDEAVMVLLLRGAGPAFCSGFDLSAAAERPALLGDLILRLSSTLRMLRRSRLVTIAAVHGPAIAGGCALVSASDLAVAAPDARLGYPVHRLGISPVVSYPTLAQAMGPGLARWLQLGGEIIDGTRAHRLGLVSHLAESTTTLATEARELGRTIASHGRAALAATKSWMNELDGSLLDERFDGPASDTANQARGEEAARLVRAAWSKKKGTGVS
jgi:methylglutaconyl-CoA hydratase